MLARFLEVGPGSWTRPFNVVLAPHYLTPLRPTVAPPNCTCRSEKTVEQWRSGGIVRGEGKKEAGQWVFLVELSCFTLQMKLVLFESLVGCLPSPSAWLCMPGAYQLHIQAQTDRERQYSSWRQERERREIDPQRVEEGTRKASKRSYMIDSEMYKYSYSTPQAFGSACESGLAWTGPVFHSGISLRYDATRSDPLIKHLRMLGIYDNKSDGGFIIEGSPSCPLPIAASFAA